MKKNILYLLFGVGLLSACLSDDSTEADLANFKDITVNGIESKYTVTSFTGEHLKISPTLDTDLPADKITHTWSLAKVVGTSYDNQDADTFGIISHDPILDYEIKLSPGKYKLRYEATAPNGYTVTEGADITATTAFEDAFYIMKETADGNTDLDYYTKDGVLVENVLSEVALGGQPFVGKPRYLSIAYKSNYLDENADSQTGNIIFVSTESGNFCGVRTTDFSVQLDKSNISFQTLEDDEKPYGAWLNMYSEMLLTSKGTRTTYSGEISPGTSGKYGAVGEATGASIYFVFAPNLMYAMVYWDADNGHFVYTDWNGDSHIITDQTYTPLDFSAYKCVGACCSYYEYMPVFALENKTTGERAFYSVNSTSDVSMLCAIPSGNVSATSNQISFNYDQGSIAYATDGKDIYLTDFTTGDERKATVNGLPSGEKITFVSNVYHSGSGVNVDYLAVGTEANGKYTVSFYKTLGGTPDGSPVFTIQGTGKVKSIRYLSPYGSGISGDNFSTAN